MFTRQNDYQHWIVCPCGWKGFSADMNHSYISYGNPDNCDIEPVDRCPSCGEYEYDCHIFSIRMMRELVNIFPQKGGRNGK